MVNNFKKEVEAFSDACYGLTKAIENYRTKMKEAGEEIPERKRLCLNYLYSKILDWHEELYDTVLDD